LDGFYLPVHPHQLQKESTYKIFNHFDQFNVRNKLKQINKWRFISDFFSKHWRQQIGLKVLDVKKKYTA